MSRAKYDILNISIDIVCQTSQSEWRLFHTTYDSYSRYEYAISEKDLSKLPEMSNPTV